MVKLTGSPRIGFRHDPSHRAWVGLVHATPTGQQSGLCGVDTPYLGGSWPAQGHPWTEPFSRCPTCAHCLYAALRP